MPPATTGVPLGLLLDGRYRIAAVIGHGGMATVYRAHDESLGRDVAIKLFPPTANTDDALRYEAEIGVLAAQHHPGLVTLLDAGSAQVDGHLPRAFIVMELVAGPNLADLIATGPLPADHTARIGVQLAGALAAVHTAQVVHRDVKPANVLLVAPPAAGGDRQPPVVKLADFGIARMIDATRLTATGTTMGTATYLSPEQAVGGPVGPPTDVYALGLVLLECLTGRKAFTGTVAEVAAARLTRSPPIPDALGSGWVTLLSEMTRQDPTERITMADAAATLALLEAAGPATPLITASDAAGDGGADRALGPRPGGPGAAPGDTLEVPTVRPWHPATSGLRLAGIAGAGLVALVLAAAALTSTPDEADRATDTPSQVVEGALGDALDDLARSVEP